MEGLTIHEAAQTTGWSARMLRYVEQTGLVTPARTASGYRIYGAAQLQRLRTLNEVTSVQHEGAGMYRVLTGNGSRTTTELVEMAVGAGVAVKSLSVQNTTLDDVFVHYTGRQLRDEQVKAFGFVMPDRPGVRP